MDSIKKYVAEAIGTFTLTLFGCGSAAIAGATLGTLGIAFAFGLSIVALDYINGGNYSYLYNLEGFDSQWNDNRHNNRLLFANLPPGNYSLNVRYRNNMTGELSPVGRLAIRVLPPPYASAWALSGAPPP